MNDFLFPLRRGVALGLVWMALCASVQAQSQAQSQSQSRAARSADFIVAVVNSQPVTHQEVQALSARLRREMAASGATPPPSAVLSEQALEMLINEKIQLQLAQELGIQIDEAQIDLAEANVAANNQLALSDFRKKLAQDGLDAKAFREQLRKQLTLVRLRERELDGRMRISEREIDEFLRAQKANAANAPLELNIAMILLAVPENSSAAAVQTLERQAQDIAQRAQKGEDFAQMAKTHSQALDRGANGGEMGLRAADRYPELFVQAVQTLPPGGVSPVLRSPAGFHILKLLERRQPDAVITVSQTRARHILLRPSAQLSREQAVQRLRELRQQLAAGRLTFAQAARQMSQDGSAAQGGDLGWASPGQFVPEFEQAMNRLAPGQLSEPLVSRFGVHLIEVMERRQVAVPEKEQREMARAALREQRTEEAYERWAEDLRARAYVEMRASPDESGTAGPR